MRDLTVKKISDSEMTLNEAQVSTGLEQQITQLSEVITCLRVELNKDLPIQHIALLLAVVEQPGISMQDLMDRLDMPQGSVSRNVKLLADLGRGYGLLRTGQDVVNRKQVVVFPTEKCLLLIEKLCRLIMEKPQDEPEHICQCSGAN